MQFLKYLFIALVFIGCSQDKTKSTVKEVVMVSLDSWKIKTCKVYSSDFEALDSENPGQLIQEFHFNRKGFANELVRYGNNGNIVGKFDILGENTPFPITNTPEFIDTMLIVNQLKSDGEIYRKEVNKYNKNGLLIETIQYNSNGDLTAKNTYTYNKQGLITKDIYWDIELDAATQVIRYKYEYFTD